MKFILKNELPYYTLQPKLAKKKINFGKEIHTAFQFLLLMFCLYNFTISENITIQLNYNCENEYL